jgi:acetyl/propionyl-CoA carboxylase alpha subunit
VPGYDGAEQSDDRLAHEAAGIGFPLLIKAVAGGGGRGMRRVDRPADLLAALSAARAEAQSAFGSAELLLERLVLRPRHLEVQLAGDRHGNLVHLFERECSIQRNYQKVLEEAPAPNLPATVRARLHEAALRLGRAIGYDSLGTAEFILEDGTEEPWFLEMNVRLQVEHPVTEAITGLDLVEWQIRAAAGEPLPLTQAEITQTGHAIEARLCAEDPAQGYRPGTGTTLRFDPPQAAGLRTDTGIAAGSAVTPHYDSLLAKLIAHAPDRPTARDRLAGALDGLVALGVPTNQAYLADIVDQPAFRSGHLTTRFLEEAFPAGWHDQVSDAAELAAVAIWLAQAAEAATGPGPWATLGAFRLLGPAGRPARTDLAIGGTRELSVSGDPARFIADGQTVTAEFRRGQISIDLASGPQSFAWAAATDTGPVRPARPNHPHYPGRRRRGGHCRVRRPAHPRPDARPDHGDRRLRGRGGRGRSGLRRDGGDEGRAPPARPDRRPHQPHPVRPGRAGRERRGAGRNRAARLTRARQGRHRLRAPRCKGRR